LIYIKAKGLSCVEYYHGMSGIGGVPMSETDQFWQFAKEAIVSVGYAKSDKEKQDLLELARTWTQAALQQRARF
jgi:hypothetical protein